MIAYKLTDYNSRVELISRGHSANSASYEYVVKRGDCYCIFTIPYNEMFYREYYINQYTKAAARVCLLADYNYEHYMDDDIIDGCGD